MEKSKSGSKRFAGVLLCVLVITLFFVLQPSPNNLKYIQELVEENLTLAVLIYILLFAISTLIFIPATIITLAGGIIFKPLAFSILIVIIGSQVGLLLATLLGKTLARPWVEAHFANDIRFAAIDRAISKEGFKIVFLLRASPVVPFGICNYLLTITSIHPMILFPATALGNLPGATLYSFLGSLIGSLGAINDFEMNPRVKYSMLLFGTITLILSVTYITMIAKKALRLALHEHNQNVAQHVQSKTREDTHSSTDSTLSSSPRRSERIRRRTASNSSSEEDLDVVKVGIARSQGSTEEEKRLMENGTMELPDEFDEKERKVFKIVGTVLLFVFVVGSVLILKLTD